MMVVLHTNIQFLGGGGGGPIDHPTNPLSVQPSCTSVSPW
jgi:hypothetical protein